MSLQALVQTANSKCCSVIWRVAWHLTIHLYGLARGCATNVHHLCSTPPQLSLLFPLSWGYLKIQARVSDAKTWLTHTQISAGKFARLLWETHTARSICSLTSLLCPSTFTYTLRRLCCPCWHTGICRVYDFPSTNTGWFVSSPSFVHSWQVIWHMENLCPRTMVNSARPRYNLNTWKLAISQCFYCHLELTQTL